MFWCFFSVRKLSDMSIQQQLYPADVILCFYCKNYQCPNWYRILRRLPQEILTRGNGLFCTGDILRPIGLG